jgi:hypothetical protein
MSEKTVVIEVSLIMEIDPIDCEPPALWDWDEIMGRIPGATLIDGGFRVINLSPEEIN